MDQVTWRKARRSNDQEEACVELAAFLTCVGVRDSKEPDGPKLLLAPTASRAILTNIKKQ